MQKKGNKTHNTAVVLIPPDELWPPIQTIRRKHDRHIRRWMPHITMIYPFRPQEEFGVMAEKFLVACQQIEPFEVQLRDFHSFHHGRGNYTLWLAPEPAEKIIQLQTALWEVVPDCDEVRKHKSGFTPHLSVGQVRSNTKMLQLKDRLQSRWQPLVFVLQEISLIWRGQPPDDVFRVGRRIQL
jgi:2'-5' RNA ligase